MIVLKPDGALEGQWEDLRSEDNNFIVTVMTMAEWGRSSEGEKCVSNDGRYTVYFDPIEQVAIGPADVAGQDQYIYTIVVDTEKDLTVTDFGSAIEALAEIIGKEIEINHG